VTAVTARRELQLDDADVRAIVRLISSTCALQGNLAQRRRHFMAGLCRMLKIDAWAWGQAAAMEPGQLPVYVGLMHGGFTEQEFARFLNVQTHADMAWMTAPICRELKDTGRHVTRNMQGVLPIPDFLATEVSALWRESGVYPAIVSFYPQADGIISALGMYRRCGAAWATERETRIAHILLSELAWIHVHESPEALLADVPRLSARQRLLLELLLQGQSRKFIAGQMGISINTVSGYVRNIYRQFQVTSQPQLVRRFLNGEGGDNA
jgi:DNA-binding CsgD family transcriptional regulator